MASIKKASLNCYGNSSDKTTSYTQRLSVTGKGYLVGINCAGSYNDRSAVVIDGDRLYLGQLSSGTFLLVGFNESLIYESESGYGRISYILN